MMRDLLLLRGWCRGAGFVEGPVHGGGGLDGDGGGCFCWLDSERLAVWIFFFLGRWDEGSKGGGCLFQDADGYDGEVSVRAVC